MGGIRWTVVITTRNRSNLLRRAIDSVLAQTVTCEIIVVDEASSDATPAVLSGYPTVHCIRNEQPVGHAAASNQGLRAAHGSWIKPLDDDDLLRPNCLAVMTAGILGAPSKRRPVLATARITHVDQGGKHLGKSRSMPIDRAVTLDSEALRGLMMLDQAPIGTPSQAAYHRETALACGGWNPENKLLFGDDTEFWIRLAHRGGCVFLPDDLAFRTIWPSNGSSLVSLMDRYRVILALKSLLGDPPRFLPSAIALRLVLTACKHRDLPAAARLLIEYARTPGAVVPMLRALRFSDARRVVAVLSQELEAEGAFAAESLPA